MPGARLSRLPATFRTLILCSAIYAVTCDGRVMLVLASGTLTRGSGMQPDDPRWPNERSAARARRASPRCRSGFEDLRHDTNQMDGSLLPDGPTP